MMPFGTTGRRCVGDEGALGIVDHDVGHAGDLANSSTWACTVDASRFTTRSAAELDRLLAMALHLSVNSRVRFSCSER